MHIEAGSRPRKLLKALLVGGGIVVVSLLAPMGGARIVQGIVQEYFRKKRFERERFLRDLKRLQQRELIDYRELPDGKVKLTLTKQGERRVLISNLDEIALNTKKRWDGKWRLVIFDIPHRRKRARDALRQKLKSLQFYPIQKSVFLTPYPCGKEIDFICSVFEIRDYVLLFTVSGFEDEEKFRKHFGL